jgi:hypothetical protein
VPSRSARMEVIPGNTNSVVERFAGGVDASLAQTMAQYWNLHQTKTRAQRASPRK